MALGLVLLAVVRGCVNNTPIPDYAIAPLLLPDTPGTADAIVVMGAGVIGDCEPNANAVQRMLVAARLLRDGRAPMLVITGGSSRRSCPVSEAMAGLAREIGVPPSKVRVETASRTTMQNAQLSEPILRELGASRLLVVSDRLHMWRASGVFTRWGFEVERASVPIYRGHPDNVSMLLSGLREYAAIAYYRVRGWMGPVNRGPGGAMTAESRVAAGAPVPTAQSGPIVIFGASYAGHWPLAEVGGVPVVNRGVGGQQTAQLVERFEADVVAAHPRMVVIWGFINDIFNTPPEAAPEAVAGIEARYLRMIEMARANGIEPVLATEITVRPDESWLDTMKGWVGGLLGKESFADRVNRHVLAVDLWIHRTARERGLLVLDLQRALSDELGRRRREFVDADGSHITPAGYDALTRYAGPILEKHVTGR